MKKKTDHLNYSHTTKADVQEAKGTHVNDRKKVLHSVATVLNLYSLNWPLEELKRS
jgi:hypothetical protein